MTGLGNHVSDLILRSEDIARKISDEEQRQGQDSRLVLAVLHVAFQLAQLNELLEDCREA